MRVKLRRKRWTIDFVKKVDELGNSGEADDATRRIKIKRGMRTRELELLIHEMLHACFWDLDESCVTEAAIDMADALKKIGYSRAAPRHR